MYLITARIRWFWWVAIFYLMAILVHFHGMGLIARYWKMNRAPADIDLWAVIVSGMFVFVAGIAVHRKSKLPLSAKAGLSKLSCWFFSRISRQI